MSFNTRTAPHDVSCHCSTCKEASKQEKIENQKAWDRRERGEPTLTFTLGDLLKKSKKKI